MNLNWNFQLGEGGVPNKNPSVGGVSNGYFLELHNSITFKFTFWLLFRFQCRFCAGALS